VSYFKLFRLHTEEAVDLVATLKPPYSHEGRVQLATFHALMSIAAMLACINEGTIVAKVDDPSQVGLKLD